MVRGQLGMVDGGLVSGGVAAQTSKAVENLKAQLASLGAELADVAKTLCFLTDMDTFGDMNKAWEAWASKGNTPARATGGGATG